MNENISPEKCPNCDTLNQINTTVCAGCGVNISNYNKYYQRIVDSKIVEHTEIPPDMKRSKKTLDRMRVIYALIGLLIAFGVVLTLLLIRNQTIRKRNAEDAFLQASEAYRSGNYFFAREKFYEAQNFGYDHTKVMNVLCETLSKLSENALSEGFLLSALEYAEECLKLDPMNQSCTIRHCEAGYSGSERLGINGAYGDAFELIDEFRLKCPNYESFNKLEYDLYSQWYELTKNDGDIGEAKRIYNEWKIKFPDPMEVIP